MKSTEESPRKAFTAANHVAVVVNGNAKRVTEDLVQILDQIVQSGDLFVSRSLEEGRDIAQRIVDRGYPTVLTGGGDGTFSQMVTWIVDECAAQSKEPPRFGLLRLGTGNALAWVLGAQSSHARGVFADIARLRREGGYGSLRMLRIADRLAPFAGLGADGLAIEHFSSVKESLQKVPGLRRFASGGLSHFISIGFRTMPEVLVRPRWDYRIINRGTPAHRLDDDGQPSGPPIEAGEVLFEGSARSVMMSTVPYWGFGARIFPFADPRSDRFNLRVVDIGSVAVASHLRSIWNGTYRSKRVHDFSVDSIEIETPEPTPLEVAGDAWGSHRRLVAELHPEPIRVVDYYAPPPMEGGVGSR